MSRTLSTERKSLLQLGRSIPDLIISDLNMPQMSGFELLSVLRWSSTNPSDCIQRSVSLRRPHSRRSRGRVLCERTTSGRTLASRGPTDSYLSRARGRSHPQVGPGLDSTQRKRLQRCTFHCAHLHGMPAIFSSKRAASGCPGNPGNTLSVLWNSRSIHHRFFRRSSRAAG